MLQGFTGVKAAGRLLWPHAFCTQDLEHALSSAYFVKNETHPWCICVDSRGFSTTNTFEDTILWKPSLENLHEDGMPKFTAICPDVVALARTKFSCVHVLNLDAAHMISNTLCRMHGALVCRLTASC